MEKLSLSLLKPVLEVNIEMAPQTFEDFEIREMNAAQMGAYMQQLKGRMVERGEGKDTTFVVNNFEGMQTALLKSSLYRKNGKLVPEEELKQWPTSTVTALFQASQKVNGLDKDSAEKDAEIKNA